MLSILGVALEIVPVIENPGSTLIHHHPRFQWMVRLLRKRGIREPQLNSNPRDGDTLVFVCSVPQVFRLAFWLKRWGHSCPKRTVIWSTSPTIQAFFSGRMRKMALTSTVRTSIKYKNRDGRSCWKGSPELKSTQLLDMCCKVFMQF